MRTSRKFRTEKLKDFFQLWNFEVVNKIFCTNLVIPFFDYVARMNLSHNDLSIENVSLFDNYGSALWCPLVDIFRIVGLEVDTSQTFLFSELIMPVRTVQIHRHTPSSIGEFHIVRNMIQRSIHPGNGH